MLNQQLQGIAETADMTIGRKILCRSTEFTIQFLKLLQTFCFTCMDVV